MIPRTQTAAACTARLALATELPPQDARAALECVLGPDREPQGQAVQIAAKSLVEHGEIAERAATRLSASYSVDEVIGNWWPEPPARSKRTGGRQHS